MSIAEQMGRTLQRTSVSVNIKERLDYSCALFGPDGGLVANAPHLPVHLGAMSEAVKFQVLPNSRLSRTQIIADRLLQSFRTGWWRRFARWRRRGFKSSKSRWKSFTRYHGDYARLLKWRDCVFRRFSRPSR